MTSEEEDDSSDEEMEVVEEPKAQVKTLVQVPPSLLRAPQRGLVTTQRAALYSGSTKPAPTNKKVAFTGKVNVRKIRAFKTQE